MLDLEQPAPELDSAAVDTATPQGNDTTETTEVSTETDLTPEQQAVADEIEEELEGVKLRGSRESLEKLKAERLMQADYTRKTQEVADTRRQLEAREAAFQQAAQSHQAHLKEVAQLVSIDDRLEQFQKLDWKTLTDQDPVQALRLHTEFTQLQTARGQLANSLTQRQQAQQQEQQRTTARQLMEARQVVERDIKGWSPELAGKLKEFGAKQGFAPEALDNITNPAVVKLLHKAYLFDQLEQQRAKKPPVAPAPPATRVSGASAANTKPLSELSDAEYLRRRREYISKNR